MIEAPIHPRAIGTLAPVVGAERVDAVEVALGQARAALAGGTVWHLNSTMAGGGVAEMLPRVLGYLSGGGLDVRWLVAEADGRFFQVTKRLHHALHGMPGDGTALGPAQRAHYEAVSAANAAGMVGGVRAGDVAVLHDPQVLGLAGPLRRAGARVVWRCHIGADAGNDQTEAGWEFLRPFLRSVDAAVFSRRSYVPPDLGCPVEVSAPTIDPLSAKNRPLDPGRAVSVLAAAGILAGPRHGRPATIVRSGAALPPDAPLVVQVSRWDPLKDPCGLLSAFTEFASGTEAHLVLAGPDVTGVTDDPEGRTTLAGCEAFRDRLPAPVRRRVHLVSLPMADPEENGLMVNALQRHAAVVVQKSLAEGFGLTVTEAMWKARPVVASAVGGIRDQIRHGRSGLLIDDPADVAATASAVRSLLDDPATAARFAAGAHQRAGRRYLDDRQVHHWATLLGAVARPEARAA